MLSTSNYVARKYGVRAAQPGFLGRKLCPDLIIVPCNFTKYRAVGNVVRKVFAEYDPNFSSHSLDEAYLDLTDHLKQRKDLTEAQRTFWRCDCAYQISKDSIFLSTILGTAPDSDVDCCPECGRPAERLIFDFDPEDAVMELRTKVFQRTSLTCSAGIAANTM